MSLSPEQIEVRRQYLGASEVAAVVGIDPFASAMEVWGRKVGLLDSSSSVASEIGSLLEGPLLTRYAKRNGVSLSYPGSVVSSTHRWARATPDAVDSKCRNVQVKVVGRRMAAKWHQRVSSWAEADLWELGVPDYVQLQVQWEMFCTGTSASIVVALIGGTDYQELPVARDDETIESLVDVCGDWWQRYVVTETQPPVDGSDACKELLLARFRTANGIEPATPEVAQLIRAYDVQRKLCSDAELRRDELGNQLRLAIGNLAGYELENGGGYAKWTPDKTGKPCWKAIAEALGATPELIKTHTSEPSRVLRVVVKGAK